jgi:hypothetical protein
MKTPKYTARYVVIALGSTFAIAGFTPAATALTCKPLELIEAERGSYVGSSGGVSTSTSAGPNQRKTIRIETVDDDDDKKQARDVAWLGISSEEAPDALSSQLGLKPGDGLVVTYVQPESPAAKAGIERNDVLVEMGDQLLVYPVQLRKLVRRQKEGDTVKLTLFRSGKKESVSAKLGKTTERIGYMDGMNKQFRMEIGDKGMQESMARTFYDKQAVNMDVQRGVEEARKAIHEALVHNGSFAFAFGPDELQAFARGGVGVGKGASVTVKKNTKSTRSMVKTDETGTYVIVANPRKRLTVHDKDGKMVFDGEIETEQQQEKIPAEIRSTIKPMLKDMGTVEEVDKPESEGLNEHPRG